MHLYTIRSLQYQSFPHKATFTASIVHHKKIAMIIDQLARANIVETNQWIFTADAVRLQWNNKIEIAKKHRWTETGSECWQISLPSSTLQRLAVVVVAMLPFKDI